MEDKAVTVGAVYIFVFIFTSVSNFLGFFKSVIFPLLMFVHISMLSVYIRVPVPPEARKGAQILQYIYIL